MAHSILGSNSEVQDKDHDKVYERLSETDKVKENLLSLKEQVASNERKKEAFEKNFNINSENEYKSTFEQMFSKFDSDVDKTAELAFQNFGHANMDKLERILKIENATERDTALKELSDEFQTYLLKQTDENITILNELALDGFKVELNGLKSDITGDTQSVEQSQNPIANEKNIEHFIDPTNLSSTMIGSITYADFDSNQDKKITKKELRESGIVDRNKNTNRDKKTAILHLLNTADTSIEKSDIRSINRDALTNILKDILRDDFLEKVIDNSGNNIDIQKFKKAFKERFHDTYSNQGLINLNEIEKIGHIIDAALSDKLTNSGLREALQRLADVGESAKNIDYTAINNDDILLEKISSNDVFLFLCDFDSDGKVNSTDIENKDKENKGRRDTGSVMGGQLYTEFLDHADTQRKDDDSHTRSDSFTGFQKKVIVDGEHTSDLIKKILLAAENESDNPLLKKSIQQFIQNHQSGNITMEEFTNFMKNGKLTDENSSDINISATADIKEFIKSLADQFNEGKDLSRLFMDTKAIRDNIMTKTNVMQELQHIDFDKENPYLSDAISQHTDKAIKDFIDANALQDTYNKESLGIVRQTCISNTIKTINFITDLIYFNLGKDASSVIAGIFSGARIAGIEYTFYNPDGTINEKTVKNALGIFIAERLKTSFGLGIGEKGHPIIGAALQYEKLDDDLGNKFEAGAGLGIDLINLFKGKLTFNFDPHIAYDLQVNKKNVTNLSTKKPISVNRIGIEGGLSFSNLSDLGLYAGLSFERDFPAGIEQKARLYDAIMKKILGYPDEITVYTTYDSFVTGIKKHISNLATKDTNIATNEEFLNDMVDEMAKQMYRSDVFKLIADQTDPNKQKAILAYMYMSFIDGFHENAIEQKSYEQLAGTLKITRFGLKTKLANIFMRTGIGASLGSVIPGRGTLMGAATGTIVGATTLSTWRTSYVEDALGKGKRNYENMETGIGAEEYQELIDAKDINKIKDFLDKKLNPNEHRINVSIQENKIILTGVNNSDILKNLNIFYPSTQEDHTNQLLSPSTLNPYLSFDGNTVTIGNASLRVSKNIKRNKVETCLIVGEDVVAKNPGYHLTKLSGKTENTSEMVKKIEPVDYYKAFTKDQIQSFINNNANLSPYKDKILGCFDNEGKLNTIDNVPATLQGKKITTGTLTFKQASNGTVTVESYDSSTPADKLTIDYITQAAIDQSKVTTIDSENYITETPISTNNLFTKANTLSVLTPDLEKTLASFDNLFQNIYQKFMESILNPGIDAFINDTEYTSAFATLKDILEKNLSYTNASETDGTVMGKFKALINSTTLGIYDKMFLVDKFKAIFSYDTKYLSGNLVPWLRDEYKKLNGPDNTTVYPLSYDYKKDLKSSMGNKKLERTPVDNLVGFTAFYRLKDNTGRKFSMTALGGTNVLSPKDNLPSGLAEIKGNDLKSAQEWFIKNLDVVTTNKGFILQKLNALLQSQHISLTIDHIDDLFRGDYVSIDNGTKKVKLNVNYYFYLLGECANESIGAKIDAITVYKKVSGNYVETTIDGSTGAINSKKIGITMKSQNVHADYDIRAKQNDLTLAAAKKGLYKKHKAEVSAGENSNSSNGNESTTSGDSQGGGNGMFGGGG